MNKLGIVVAGSLLSLGAFAADDGVILGGYVDAGFTSVMIDKAGGAKMPDRSGFLVREGAIYLGKKWGTEWEVFGDFAFSSNGSTLTDSAGDTSSTGPTVSVAQAFISNTMDNGFGWKLGKFDGIFGYYAGRKDSHAHHLTDTGYIQGAYLPGSHLGWLGSYSFSDMLKFSLLVANDDESFGYSSGAASAGGGSGAAVGSSGFRRPDLGVLVNADFDAFSADLGAYIMTGEDNAASGKAKLGYVVSAVFEGNFNPLTFGVYGVFSQNDADNITLGAKNSSDFGVGANVGYAINDKFGADLRVEYVAMNDKFDVYDPTTQTWLNITGGTPGVEAKSVMAGTIGGSYKFNDNVKAKLDYTYAKFDTKGAGAATIDPFHIVQAGVVANF
jgi:hypothetical protein